MLQRFRQMISLFFELWCYRALLHNLAIRNFRMKYQSSFFGFAWTLLNPLLILSVLLIVFSHVIRIPIPHYWAFLISGYFVWNNINQTLSFGSLAIEEHSSLVRNYSFPIEIPVIAGIISRLLELGIELLIVTVILVVFHHGHVPVSLFMIPVLLVMQFLINVGLALIVATFSIFYEDVRYMLSVVLMALFYISPVFYKIELVPENLRRFYYINPVAPLLVCYQSPLYDGKPPPWNIFLILVFFAIAIFFIGMIVFKRYRGYFAEII